MRSRRACSPELARSSQTTPNWTARRPWTRRPKWAATSTTLSFSTSATSSLRWGMWAGKGIGAALFMARSLALLRAEALRRRALHEMLGRVNEALARGNEQATFVALTCGILDRSAGRCAMPTVVAGRPSSRRRQWSRMLMPRGIVVGAIPGFTFESARARLAPGDALVLFSDGVTEATSPEGELFGAERSKGRSRTCRGQKLSRADRRGPNGRARVRRGAAPLYNDLLTLLVVRRPLSAVPEPAPSTKKKNGVD